MENSSRIMVLQCYAFAIFFKALAVMLSRKMSLCGHYNSDIQEFTKPHYWTTQKQLSKKLWKQTKLYRDGKVVHRQNLRRAIPITARYAMGAVVMT